MDETLPSLATVIENLARAQSELLRAADAVPADQWKTKPAEERWRKAPVPPEPQLVREKEEMLAELRGVRGRTLAFIEVTRGRELIKYRMPHPFLGSLNAYQWLQFIAAHE
jgi:hypothetical protein